MFYALLKANPDLEMRSIDEIIEEAQQAMAASFREAFAQGGSEAAREIRMRMNAFFASPAASQAAPQASRPPEPAIDKPEGARREFRDRPAKPALRAILLGVAAILALAMWHARAARILPACALLIGLGAFLRDWRDEAGE
jgi:uncharacterized membrane protein